MKNICEVCEGEKTQFLFSKEGYDFLRCLQCGHIFNPLTVSAEHLAQLYEDDFFEAGGYADYVADQETLKKNFAQFIKILKPYCPSGRLLEIGCAYGFFLSSAQSYWQVEGIDICEKATRYAREKLGVDARQGNFLETPFPEKSYDVVVLWDTIEHLTHPSRYVEKAAGLLKPGGILAMTTGDAGSLVARLQGKAWRLYYPPYHLHYFSRQTLAQLMKRFGLTPIGTSWVGYDRSLDMILHRLLHERKPRPMQKLYRIAKRVGLANRTSVYLNLFDIMLMVARKPAST